LSQRLTSVSKFFARLGQCFSATVTGPQLCTSASPSARLTGVGDWSYAEVVDVERNGYCFTDGVGVVSRHLAEQIAAALGLREGVVPSAFQIRFAGYKGEAHVWRR
jgi:RNA-dependent RNA polymerase